MIVFCGEPHSFSEMLSHLGLADRTKFRRKYIHRLLQANIIELTIPDKPNSQHQKYRLTPKGLQLKKLLEKEQVICTCQKKAVPSRAPTSFARPLKCTFTSPPRKYVREMQPIPHRRSKLFIKIGYASFTSRYTPTRKQTFSSCRACCEIDESIFFQNNFSLHLRMCIFCSTFVGVNVLN